MRTTQLVLCGLLLGLAAVASAAESGKDLVANGDFSAAGNADLPAAAWSLWTPLCKEAAVTCRRTPEGLLVDSPREPYGVGGVTQTLSGIEGGKAYAVEAACELRSIPSPLRAVNVRLLWMHGKKPLHPAGMLVRGPVVEAGRATFRDVLVAPAEADTATLSLEVKWPEGGSVLFRRVSVRPTDPPAPRKVKVGAVYLRPANSTPEKNMDLWCEKVDEAGKLGLDIVCLGEAILAVGTRATGVDVAEAIPGPSTERLGAAAKKNRLWIVAGLYERNGTRIYNTAVLLDRDGKLVGTYRKVHLPREEWTKGITPGTEYPVFKTELGIIGIQICYDWFFPEAAEIFALKGAEILFAPTWGDTAPDADGRAQGETVFRTRARDNGLYLVPCVYDGSSMVIDPMGRMLSSSKGPTAGIFWSEIDLSTREPLPWVGYWRSIGPRDRMPETYAPLTDRGQQAKP